MKNTVEIYKNAIIQIASPWGTGSGFYVKKFNTIVTNRHVVEGCKEVVISGKLLKKTIAEVFFTDPVHDLAFIKAPENIDFPDISLGNSSELFEGEQIMAIGHPYGLKFTATQGIISKAQRKWNGVNYIQIDAAINPGNSGGPLIDNNNNVIGVNTFIIQDSNNLGFALPINYLISTYNDYLPFEGKKACRCKSCLTIVTTETIENEYCPNCGEKIGKTEFEGKNYIPSSAGKKIEEIILKLNYDIRLARVGINFWEIEEGSAKIKITYNPDNRYLVASSVLCRVPKTNISAIYEFLLKENYNLTSMVFCVIQQDIMLSTIYIYDEDIHLASGLELFKNLFKLSDYYDDVLIKMGAIKIDEDEED